MRYIFILCLLVSCSQSNEEFTKVRLTFNGPPDQSKSYGVSSPTVIGNYNCFGVIINIPSQVTGQCLTNGNVKVADFSLILGTVELGEEMQVEISSGPSRKFSVFGFQSLGDCPTMGQDLATMKHMLSPPSILGSTVVDIQGSAMNVGIVAQIANQVEFDKCVGSTTFTGTAPFNLVFNYPQKHRYFYTSTVIANIVPEISGFNPDTFGIVGGAGTFTAETGLSFNATTGVISGTTIGTATVGIRRYVMTALDSSTGLQTDTKIYIVIAPDFHIVTDNSWTADANPADDLCDHDGAAGNQCSLRAAIQEVTGTEVPGIKPIIIPAGIGAITTTGNILISNAANPNDFILMGMGDDQSVIIPGGGTYAFTNAGNDDDFYLSGLTFRNGAATGGATGAFLNQATSETFIYDCLFDNNSSSVASGKGGALSIDGATPTAASIFDSVFKNNSVTGVNGIGGALYFLGGTLTVEGNIFEDNQATGANSTGGAIHLVGHGTVVSTMLIQKNYFKSNFATLKGGGISIAEPSAANADTVTIKQNTFETNSTGTSGGEFGGAIYNLSQKATNVFENNTFSGNQSHTGGHIVYDPAAAQTLNLRFNTFVNGDSTVGDGGAIHAGNFATINLIGNLFSGNMEAAVEGDCGITGGGAINGDGVGGGLKNMTSGPADGCFVGTDVVNETNIRLQPLQDPLNQGRTFYFLKADSAAVDGFPGGGCAPTTVDALGTARPLDGPDLDAIADCDFGAIELYFP